MPHLNVLAGDTVTWHNASLRAHDVAAEDRSLASPRLLMDAMFELRFGTPGTYAYLCRLHPTMRGDIAVHRLLLDAAKEPAAPGKPYALKGRAALPEGATVSIQADGVEQTTATVDATRRVHRHGHAVHHRELHRRRRHRVRARPSRCSCSTARSARRSAAGARSSPRSRPARPAPPSCCSSSSRSASAGGP